MNKIVTGRARRLVAVPVKTCIEHLPLIRVAVHQRAIRRLKVQTIIRTGRQNEFRIVMPPPVGSRPPAQGRLINSVALFMGTSRTECDPKEHRKNNYATIGWFRHGLVFSQFVFRKDTMSRKGIHRNSPYGLFELFFVNESTPDRRNAVPCPFSQDDVLWHRLGRASP